jgi:hypothetical protein
MIASKTSQATVAIAWDVAGVTNGPVTTSVVVSNSALALAIFLGRNGPLDGDIIGI